MEGAVRLSQYYDVLNSLHSVSDPYRFHLKFLESLSETVQKLQNSLHGIAGTLVAALASVTHRRDGEGVACRACESDTAAKYGSEEEEQDAEGNSGESGGGAGKDARAFQIDAYVPCGMQEQ